VPELPEVEALAEFLRQQARGCVLAGVEVGEISVLKTFDPPPSALLGLEVSGVARHGKFLDLEADGLHLVFHLARAGWLRWYDEGSGRPRRGPGKGPLALRVRLDCAGAAAGARCCGQTRVRPDRGGHEEAVGGLRRPLPGPGAGASPRSAPTRWPTPSTVAALASILAGSRQQVKGLLREQSVIAGVGNAYSDEVLHAARLSPFAIAGGWTTSQVKRLFTAMREVLTGAIAAASGRPAKELKDAKRAGMRVHGRAGQPCPVCGDTVREVSFADSSLQYCPTCQTGGKLLADRRLSRLLK
jgi:formamidopyrimidine-DNA glycosylase